MRVILASHWGMCFGVKDALALARDSAATGPFTVLGSLVHNPHVVEDLSRRGIQSQPDPDRVTTGRAMITAHGASHGFKNRARAAGLTLIDSTCPLVKKAHWQLNQLVLAGAAPLVIGKPGHPEVRGLTEDLPGALVALREEDIDRLPRRSFYGVVAQTTQPIGHVRRLVDRLRRRQPDSRVEFRDTFCQPTKDRQESVTRLARQCDLVIVVGGEKSNNTRQLVNTCRALGTPARQVESVLDLDPAWFKDVDTVGLTAGTSTPDESVHQVHGRLLELAHPVAAIQAS